MKKLLVVTAAVTSLMAATATSASAAPRVEEDMVHINIVGGSVTQEKLPWITDLGFCTATLVNERWVLTAAHCLGMGARSVKIGSNDRNKRDGEVVQIRRQIRHPQYGGDAAGYDIGLIELLTPAKGAPMKVSGVKPGPGTPTKILGWGRTTPDGRGSTSLLKELNTSVIEPSGCVKQGWFDDKLELCTDNPGKNSGACRGDSGGPQIMKVDGEWRLVGVTSGGPKLCASEPSFYTSTAAHMDWIVKTTAGAVKPAQ